MANGPEHPPSSTLERKLVAVLSADVAEYSRLMAEDEEQTLRIFREHSQIFGSLVTMYHGRIFNTAGDAILAEFTSTVGAVRCATEIQSALRTRNDQLPLSRQVRFRIGINVGDVMVQNSDLLGDGVNVAARLQAAAEPGGICISGSVYDQIRNKLSLTFESLGERHYKNISQPVRTFTITGTDKDGDLPSSHYPSKSGRVLTQLTVVALSLFALAGGYSAYYMYQRSQLGQASRQPQLTRPDTAVIGPAPKQASDKPSVQTPTGAASQPSPTDLSHNLPGPTTQQASPQLSKQNPMSPLSRRSPGDQPRVRPGPVLNSATAAIQASKRTSIQPEVSPATGVTDADGTYVGRVCYGEGPQNPAHCFRGQATVVDGKISGQWRNGPAGGIMLLSGVAAPAGDVTIELHPEEGGRMQIRTAKLLGTLHDGRLEATGTFPNGRTISLTWHRI